MPATLRHAHPEVADDRRDGDAQLGSDLVHRQTTPPVEVSGVSGESFRPYRARARNPCVRASSPLTTCPSPSQDTGESSNIAMGHHFLHREPFSHAAFRALADSRRTRRSICRTVPSLSPYISATSPSVTPPRQVARRSQRHAPRVQPSGPRAPRVCAARPRASSRRGRRPAPGRALRRGSLGCPRSPRSGRAGRNGEGVS